MSRQACSVESAARRSGLSVNVIMFSKVLHLKDNATCNLYKSNFPIKFYSIDLDTFTQDTPLELFFSSSKLSNSEYSAVHKADALRLLMVYKFGGFYLDLDYVVFNDLTHYHNIVVGNDE